MGNGAAAPADLVESYVLTSASLAAPERHDRALVGCGAAYVASARELLRLLHLLSARALGAPEDTFERLYDSGASISLRLAHYPARGGPGDVAGAEDDSAERYGPHKDYQGFTLLAVEEPEDRCLEVWLQGRWCKVPCPRGAIIVNTGELMAHWTNGRWRPTLHRVVKGPRDRPRFSIPLFTGPNPEALVVPLGDKDSRRGIKAGDHLSMQLGKSQVSQSKL
jgi:isopenicillin N synthase-like dioxygenase